MDELIRKQDAIDAVNIADDNGQILTILDVLDVIKALPTVQPEIMRCKDCEWWTKQPDSAQGRCALLGIYPTGAWYCANAMRIGEADG